jgi:hypothetical protein
MLTTLITVVWQWQQPQGLKIKSLGKVAFAYPKTYIISSYHFAPVEQGDL